MWTKIAFYVAVGLLLTSIVGSAMYMMRLFSNATTPITLHEVAPEVICATMVTADGAAIDCWPKHDSDGYKGLSHDYIF